MIRATFKGNFGADPELNYTQGGTAVLNANLATERSAKVDGEWTKVTDWVRIVAWGRKAEAIEEYFGKGGQIIIHGTLETTTWEDKDGNKRYGWQIRVDDFEFVTKTQKSGQDRGREMDSEPDDDIPF